MKQHRETRAALHHRSDRGAVGTEDEIALPVAGYCSVLRLGGTRADHDLLPDESLARPAHTGSGDSQRSAAAQAGRELSSQRAAPLHVERLVDRLMRDA